MNASVENSHNNVMSFCYYYPILKMRGLIHSRVETGNKIVKLSYLFSIERLREEMLKWKNKLINSSKVWKG